MQDFLTTLLECSISMSIVSLVYMTVMPLLSKRYTAKWLYYVWLVIVVGWVFPFRPQFDRTALPVQMPVIQVMPMESIEYMDTVKPLVVAANETGKALTSSSIPIWWIIAGIWIIGALGTVVYHVGRHWRFVKLVSRWSEDVTDSKILGILDDLKAEMKIGANVGLKTCSGITSPMMVGFIRPTIFLPPVRIDSDALSFILKHELVHLKRRDLWYKALVLLAAVVHWFNPVVYIMAKAIAKQCEFSCDELVLQGANFEQRRRYGETIIGVARNGAKLQTALSTNFYGGKKGMKTRIFSIMNTKKKKAGIAILCVVLIAIIGTGMAFTFRSTNDNSVNVTADTQAEEPIIGPTETKEVIDIDVESLDIGEFVCVGGPYTLEEGDIIQYDITSEGKGHLNAVFRKTNNPNDNEGYLGALGITGNCIRDYNSFIVSESLAGEYYLWVGNYDGKKIKGLELTEDDNTGILNNIKGTVNIAVEINGQEREKEAVKEAAEILKSNDADSGLPTKLIAVKMSDGSKFRPEEWKDILAKVENGENEV